MAKHFLSHLKVSRSLNSDQKFLTTLIGLFVHALNFTYELVSPYDNQFGRRLENGSWTGLVRMILHNECDVVFDVMAVTEERNQVIDFMFPFDFTDITFLTNKPVGLPKRFAIIQPFSYFLWLALLVSLIVMSLLFYKCLGIQETYKKILMRMFGSLLLQPFPYILKKSSKRLMMISWLLAVLFLTLSYQATLLSFLTVPSLLGVRNIKELAEAITKGTYIAKTNKNSFLISFFLNSPDESVRIIGKSLTESNDNPNLEFDDFFRKYQAGYVTGRRVLSLYKRNHYLSDDSFFFTNGAFGLPKSFCCKSVLDETSMRIFETGLYEKIWRNMIVKSELKQNVQEDVQYISTLNLDDVSGAFIFLITGYMVACLIFVLEKIFAKR